MRGLFITFEGIDGAGKTTQQHLAAQALREQGYDVLESREPGGTQLAEKVRASVMPAFAEGLEVRAAQLHNDAGMVGAVYYFRQTMEKE